MIATWRDGLFSLTGKTVHQELAAQSVRSLVGTDDARILRVDPDGAQQYLTGFDAVAGRDKWYAGAAIIDAS
ncbi:MAG: hypothetical protein GIW97_07525 [Candidatus Eremiobacteraeota bacterium]|nr:hypothetical protein [Candidatus Eremiobacteraeota bacterium]